MNNNYVMMISSIFFKRLVVILSELHDIEAEFMINSNRLIQNFASFKKYKMNTYYGGNSSLFHNQVKHMSYLHWIHCSILCNIALGHLIKT